MKFSLGIAGGSFAIIAALAAIAVTERPALADMIPPGCSRGPQPCEDVKVCVGIPDNYICSTKHYYQPQ